MVLGHLTFLHLSILAMVLAAEYNEFTSTFAIGNLALLDEQQWPSAPNGDEQLCSPVLADVLWVVDGSRSMGIDEAAVRTTKWIKAIISDFLNTVEMGPNKTRMGFLEFSGPNSFEAGYFPTLGDSLNLTDPIASSRQLFTDWMNQEFSFLGGSTDIPTALHHVREHMLLDTTDARKRLVFLITDGAPTDSYGRATELMLNATHEAALQLKEEDDATLILVRVQGQANFPSQFLHGIADYTFDLVPGILNTLRVTVGLCHQPTQAPTMAPSRNPSNSPLLSLSTIYK